jgi:ABC-2 type transport system permease protein
MSDRLAGIDAPRYADFVQAVNQFEDQWRSFFVPLIMASTPWSDDLQNSLPQFVVAKDGDSSASLSLPLSQLKIAMILLILLVGFRNRFAKT